jgi:hypothetical protein
VPRAGGAAPQSVTFAFRRRQAGAQLRKLLFDAGLAALFQRQKVGQLRDLRVEPLQRGVFAGDFLLQVELHNDEHSEQEDDAEDQGRQRVDEAWPIIHAAVAAARSGKCHRSVP